MREGHGAKGRAWRCLTCLYRVWIWALSSSVFTSLFSISYLGVRKRE